MAWIELHQTLPRHPKLLRLANRLRIHPAQAAGHLTFLWLWALDYAPQGDVSALAPAEISAAACFPGDAETFAKALQDCGWLDGDGQIHDWLEYAGRIVNERAKARERMRAFREQQRNTRESSGNVRRTFAERAELPNPTQPYRTEKEEEKRVREGSPGPSDPPEPPKPTPSLPPAPTHIEPDALGRVIAAGDPETRFLTEPPPGFPTSEDDARRSCSLWGVGPEVAARAWLLAASRGWRDARDVLIRSWPHYVAHCQARERDRLAEQGARAGSKPRGESAQIQEKIPVRML